MKSLQTKYSTSATKDRYKDVDNQATVKDKEINKLEAEKKSLEKTLNEKEKAIDNIREQIGADSKVRLFCWFFLGLNFFLIRFPCYKMN